MFFEKLILGHLIGDYVLQNKWMALNKSGNTFKCAIHCSIYTLAVIATTWSINHSIGWVILIFLSHFVIDRWSLADKWLRLINGRSLTDYLINGKKDIPKDIDIENYHILRGSFTSLVYAVVDNTFHILIMYYGIGLL